MCENGCPLLSIVRQVSLYWSALVDQRQLLNVCYSHYMYVASVAVFMFLFPVLSVVTEVFVNKNHANLILLVGKWFVFWAIGVRLFTAGIRQIVKPGLTAEGILGIKDKASWTVVRELGFANFCMGLAGIISLWLTDWRPAVAFIAGLFLLLDGLMHTKNERNFEENIAMYSDLFLGAVMAVYLVSFAY